MKIPHKYPQFTEMHALIIVSAKEQGVLYTVNNGIIEKLVKVEEHGETPSDNEGFFFRSGYGKHFGSGNPEEKHDEESLRVFVKSIVSEINSAIDDLKPDVIYLFQPAHFKGYLREQIKNNTSPVHLVKFGNFVHQTPLEIVIHIANYLDESVDPTDPSSVEGEENADEKRKLLEKGL